MVKGSGLSSLRVGIAPLPPSCLSCLSCPKDHSMPRPPSTTAPRAATATGPLWRLPVLGSLLLGVVLFAGCGAPVSSSGNFTPASPHVLTVATFEVPVPGLWTGTAEHPTGGFEYELAVNLAHHLGLDGVRVVIVPFPEILAGHLHGADLAISDVTATTARQAHLQFSAPYLSATPAILSLPGQRINDLNAARARSWSVQRGTTLSAFVENTIKPKKPTTYATNDKDVIDAVTSGRAEAALLDLPVALGAARTSPGHLVVTGQFTTQDDLSAALDLSSTNLEAVDSAINFLVANGTINNLAGTWLGQSFTGTTAKNIPLIPAIP